MKSIESSARTMEEAVSQGLEKLGASFEDVKIEILDEGSKGFLGIWGGKPVVVRLTLREDLEAPDVISSVGLSDALEYLYTQIESRSPNARQSRRPCGSMEKTQGGGSIWPI